ncbi:hypothetical protein GCM10010123_18250 [Pilimelia anulata]|uniref:Uncharacterized protein n=1 Tax=Pilimelia anulata TaxID=53371 RepID=A0A8J3B5H3_9ACTN|nr:hypothetical protein [Pilimelia anulata]GGJ89035.1 hypothetical protein GCM10010123_18250 [Pilimelia anulata]
MAGPKQVAPLNESPLDYTQLLAVLSLAASRDLPTPHSVTIHPHLPSILLDLRTTGHFERWHRFLGCDETKRQNVIRDRAAHVLVNASARRRGWWFSLSLCTPAEGALPASAASAGA